MIIWCAHLYDQSQLIPNSNPVGPQIVPPSKDLQIVPIGHQLLNKFINFSRFLTLSSTFTENYIRGDSFIVILEISLVSNETGLLGMLQVEAVTLSDLAIDRLLDPIDGIDYFVAPLLLHHVDCPLEFGVDDPDEEEALTL